MNCLNKTKVKKLLIKVFDILLIIIFINILLSNNVRASSGPIIPTVPYKEVETYTIEYYRAVYVAVGLFYFAINLIVVNLISIIYKKRKGNKIRKTNKYIIIISLILIVTSLIIPNIIGSIFGKTEIRKIQTNLSSPTELVDTVKYAVEIAFYLLFEVSLVSLFILSIIMIYQKIKHKKVKSIIKCISIICLIMCIILFIEILLMDSNVGLII